MILELLTAWVAALVPISYAGEIARGALEPEGKEQP